ncbi:MAG: hypothetical protein MJ169_00875 [Treponema sp.]|nr:hypothetical protein [Treponema sp.]
MDKIQKFYSDIEKAKKFNRRENGGSTMNNEQVVNQVLKLFEQNNYGLGDLPRSLGDYWFSTYARPKMDAGQDPLDSESVDKLCAITAFLSDDDQTQALTENDWKEIAPLVSYEADDLPIDVLSSLMGVLVSKKAL